MTDTPFDTLAMSRDLETAGFSAQQAQAVAEAVRTGVTGGVATKADQNEIKAKLEKLEAKIDIEMKWMKAIGAALFALLAFPLLREFLQAAPLP